MKKWIAFILTTALAISLIAGCGSGSATAPANVPQDSQPGSVAPAPAPQQPAAPQQPTEQENPGQGGVKPSDPGKLIMGLDDSFAPMGYRDDKGEITGFDVDLAKEVAKRLGRELVLQPIDWDSKEIELASGNIDCIWNGFTITPERQANMELTAPYIANNQMILVTANGAIKSKGDLSGKEIGVQKGSSALDAVNDDELAGMVSAVSEYPQNVDAFNDLKVGRIAAVVADEIMARYYLATDAYKDLILLDDVLAPEEFGVGFRKGNTELRDAVQVALFEMIYDGAAGKISEGWFGKDIMIRYAKDKFVMGLDDSFAPMGFRDDRGNIVGFDVDLAREVTKRLGMELILQPIDWDSKEMELSSGNIDCIWNGFTITPERQANMEMTAPYIANNQMILVMANGSITTKADLTGKEIGVQKGSSALDAVNDDELAGMVSLVSEYPQNVDAFNDLKAGRLAAVVADEIMARYYLATDAYKDLILLDDALAPEEFGVGFKKDNFALRDAVQAVMNLMVKDGAAGKISADWFGKDVMIRN